MKKNLDLKLIEALPENLQSFENVFIERYFNNIESIKDLTDNFTNEKIVQNFFIKNNGEYGLYLKNSNNIPLSLKMDIIINLFESSVVSQKNKILLLDLIPSSFFENVELRKEKIVNSLNYISKFLIKNINEVNVLGEFILKKSQIFKSYDIDIFKSIINNFDEKTIINSFIKQNETSAYYVFDFLKDNNFSEELNNKIYDNFINLFKNKKTVFDEDEELGKELNLKDIFHELAMVDKNNVSKILENSRIEFSFVKELYKNENIQYRELYIKYLKYIINYERNSFKKDKIEFNLMYYINKGNESYLLKNYQKMLESYINKDNILYDILFVPSYNNIDSMRFEKYSIKNVNSSLFNITNKELGFSKSGIKLQTCYNFLFLGLNLKNNSDIDLNPIYELYKKTFNIYDIVFDNLAYIETKKEKVFEIFESYLEQCSTAQEKLDLLKRLVESYHKFNKNEVSNILKYIKDKKEISNLYYFVFRGDNFLEYITDNDKENLKNQFLVKNFSVKNNKNIFIKISNLFSQEQLDNLLTVENFLQFLSNSNNSHDNSFQNIIKKDYRILLSFLNLKIDQKNSDEILKNLNYIIKDLSPDSKLKILTIEQFEEVVEAFDKFFENFEIMDKKKAGKNFKDCFDTISHLKNYFFGNQIEYKPTISEKKIENLIKKLENLGFNINDFEFFNNEQKVEILNIKKEKKTRKNSK